MICQLLNSLKIRSFGQKKFLILNLIESNLFGIRQRDLTKPNEKKYFILKKIGTQEFFKTPRVFIPEPLVVQRNQRPVGPFSGR